MSTEGAFVPVEPDVVFVGSPPSAAEAPTEPLVEDELLVEEVSIDGMCGVY